MASSVKITEIKECDYDRLSHLPVVKSSNAKQKATNSNQSQDKLLNGDGKEETKPKKSFFRKAPEPRGEPPSFDNYESSFIDLSGQYDTMLTHRRNANSLENVAARNDMKEIRWKEGFKSSFKSQFLRTGDQVISTVSQGIRSIEELTAEMDRHDMMNIKSKGKAIPLSDIDEEDDFPDPVIPKELEVPLFDNMSTETVTIKEKGDMKSLSNTKVSSTNKPRKIFPNPTRLTRPTISSEAKKREIPQKETKKSTKPPPIRRKSSNSLNSQPTKTEPKTEKVLRKTPKSTCISVPKPTPVPRVPSTNKLNEQRPFTSESKKYWKCTRKPPTSVPKSPIDCSEGSSEEEDRVSTARSFTRLVNSCRLVSRGSDNMRSADDDSFTSETQSRDSTSD